MARLQRCSPLLVGIAATLLGGAASAALAHRAHGLDRFEVVVLGMAAVCVAVTALWLLDPAWIITAGLILSVFSGNWGNIGIPIPLDRLALAAGLVSAFLRARSPDGRGRLRMTGLHWAMLILIVYSVASAAWIGTLTAHGPLFALLDRLGVFPFLLFLVAPVAFGEPRQRRILANGLLGLGLYLGLVTLFEAIGVTALVIPHYISDPTLGLHVERGRGPFLEAGANGLAMFYCICAAAMTLTWDRRRGHVLLAAAVIVLCTAGLVFTLTRQTWVAAAAGALVAAGADARLRRWLPGAAAAAVLTVLIALAVVPGLSSSLNNRVSDQQPVWDRLNSDAAALRMIESRPAIGFGWGGFTASSRPYYRLAATYPLTSVGEAHNMILSNGAELGLLGAGAWLVIVVVAIGRPAVRRAADGMQPWRIALIAGAIAWLVQSNFTPLDYAFDNYVPWLWAGIVWAPWQQRALATSVATRARALRPDRPQVAVG